MTQHTDLLPEEVLIAVLHKVGQSVRLVDDNRLASVFDNAARKSSSLGAFKKHPQYHYSGLLSNTLQILDLGGAIVRENAPAKYFKVSAHTAGPYGASVLARIPADDRRVVDELAKDIRETFGA